MAFQGRSSQSVTIGVDGTGQIVFTPGGNKPWRLTQLSIESDQSNVGASCVMRLNGRFVTFLIVTGDAAGGDPPIDLYPGDQLVLEWSDCAPTSVASALAFYDLLDWQAQAVNP